MKRVPKQSDFITTPDLAISLGIKKEVIRWNVANGHLHPITDPLRPAKTGRGFHKWMWADVDVIIDYFYKEKADLKFHLKCPGCSAPLVTSLRHLLKARLNSYLEERRESASRKSRT